MTEPDLPWVPAAVRALLLTDPPFVQACGGRCGTRLPADLTVPCARIRVPAPAVVLGGGAYRPLVQVEGWCAPTAELPDDPEAVAWRIASRAVRVLNRARNVAYESMRYSARVIDGPMPATDTSRGPDTPLYWALVRAELTVHNR